MLPWYYYDLNSTPTPFVSSAYNLFDIYQTYRILPEQNGTENFYVIKVVLFFLLSFEAAARLWGPE